MFYTVCPQQISELSVDVESKQKELQSLQQDKSSLEQQLTSLVREEETHFIIMSKKQREERQLCDIQKEDDGIANIASVNNLLKLWIFKHTSLLRKAPIYTCTLLNTRQCYMSIISARVTFM